MLDIIIPCYNSKTLPRTLASIMTQSFPSIRVTIVNDGGDKCDIDNFKPYLNIQYLETEHKGIGHARNYGLEHTDGEGVMFLDSDDVLNDPFSLERLVDKFVKENSVICIGGFIEQNYDGFIPHTKDTGFIHGKLYRRSYLEKYKIRFNEEYNSNEDVGFNLLAMLLLNGENVSILDSIVHCWLLNPDSIVRKNRIEYEDRESFIGYVNNMIYVYNELEKRNVNTPRIFQGKITVMERIYLLYKTKTSRSPQYKNVNLDACKKYYNKIYKPIIGDVTNDLLEKSYSNFKTEISLKEIKKFINTLGGKK